MIFKAYTLSLYTLTYNNFFLLQFIFYLLFFFLLSFHQKKKRLNARTHLSLLYTNAQREKTKKQIVCAFFLFCHFGRVVFKFSLMDFCKKKTNKLQTKNHPEKKIKNKTDVFQASVGFFFCVILQYF